ncbi:MAG: Xaa-Pro peptidase family protein [Verrucomicrobiota bacterium]
MSGSAPLLEPEKCRHRQERLCHYLESHELDGAVFFDRHYIHGLTGHWHDQPLTPVALLVTQNRNATLVTHQESIDSYAIDEVISYIPNHLFTLKPNLSACVAEVLNPALRKLRRIGTEQQVPAALIEGPVCSDISEDYQYIRRHKDDDEVAILEFSIACAGRAYLDALQMLEPGVTEVEIMAAMLEEATFAVGEFLSGWGQDFKCGAPGGFASRRPVEDGELFCLDIGVGVRGYRSDLCRTFAVNGSPSEAQLAAHSHIVEVMKRGESMLRPGQSCREMFDAVHRELEGWQGYSFFHHAGHGIGLDAHEVPRINPAWDDTFEVGDVVAFEPGLYGNELKGGIRLENNYLITEDGFRQLSHFPLDLVQVSSWNL